MVTAGRGRQGDGGATLVSRVRQQLEAKRSLAGRRCGIRGFLSAYKFWKLRRELRELHERFEEFRRDFGDFGEVSESEYFVDAFRRAQLTTATAIAMETEMETEMETGPGPPGEEVELTTVAAEEGPSPTGGAAEGGGSAEGGGVAT